MNIDEILKDFFSSASVDDEAVETAAANVLPRLRQALQDRRDGVGEIRAKDIAEAF